MATKKAKRSSPNKELIIVMILSLTLGVGGGFALGAMTTVDTENEESSMSQDDTPHSHGMSGYYNVPSESAPTVDVVVTEDAKSGYNVRLNTQNFTFAPENVNKENVLGEGHAHLYVDGEKVGRLYGPDFHYDGSFEGTKTFKATLNANDHSEYAVDNKVIENSVEVTHDSYDPDHDASHMN